MWYVSWVIGGQGLQPASSRAPVLIRHIPTLAVLVAAVVLGHANALRVIHWSTATVPHDQFSASDAPAALPALPGILRCHCLHVLFGLPSLVVAVTGVRVRTPAHKSSDYLLGLHERGRTPGRGRHMSAAAPRGAGGWDIACLTKGKPLQNHQFQGKDIQCPTL